ncbi:MAG: alternative ribosome rescue aminoacyl-tRNA hydrolase ArfB [Anaerolineae bacterium]|jgi:ribosome-associated protein
MDGRDEIWISDELSIPAGELTFDFVASGGPGGQHVNKTATKVLLRFDVARSPSLTERQRELITARLASRIDGDGVLAVQARDTRSQLKNRELAVGRFRTLLREALTEQPPRRQTKPSRSAVERRLADKKRRSEAKRRRRYTHDRDD